MENTTVTILLKTGAEAMMTPLPDIDIPAFTGRVFTDTRISTSTT